VDPSVVDECLSKIAARFEGATVHSFIPVLARAASARNYRPVSSRPGPTLGTKGPTDPHDIWWNDDVNEPAGTAASDGPSNPQGDPTAIPDGKPNNQPAERPHRVVRRIARGILSYGVVILALWFLVNNLQSTTGLSSAISLITAAQVAVICVLGVVNLATNWPPLVVALPGLRIREAAVTNTASAALSNTVPEGGAVATGLNYAMLRSWGFSLSDITSEVIVTGTWSQFTKYILLAIALVVVVLQGWAPSGTGWVALGLAALVIVAIWLLGMILRSEAFAVRLGRWVDGLIAHVTRVFHKIGPSHLATTLPRSRSSMVRLLRVCWHKLTVAEVVSQLTAAFVLGVACRMQGLGESTITWAVIVVAWGAVTLASLIIPTPGGLGVAEVVLVTLLGYGLPDSDHGAVVSAVLLYRLATFLLPIPIGLVTYLYWRRSTAWRHPANSRGPSAEKSSAVPA